MKKAMMIIGIVSAILVAGMGILIFSAEKYTARAEFCGLQCHTMKNPYETWRKDKHKAGRHSKIKKDVACVDCHYAPGEKPTPKAKFRALGQLFSYLATKDKEVRKRAVVKDLSCMTLECHPKEKFLTKKIEYKKAYQTDFKGTLLPFTHKTHEEKTVEGQKLHCSSCHIHFSAGKHFEVPKETCFLCHFRKAKEKENEGRAKCSICHEISKKALQAKKSGADADENGSKQITHQSIEKAKVSCGSCHFELIRGNVDVKKDSCIDCHHDPTPELMKKIEDKKKMHNDHVTKQTARCFNCHQTIEHKESPYLDEAIRNCATCHPEPHIYQKMIIAGEGGRGVGKFPIAHHPMKTNCLGCHTKDGHDAKGRKVKKAEEKTCVNCHDKEAGETMKKWTKDMADALKEAKAAEKEAIDAMEKAKGKVPEKELQKAIVLIKKGQDNFRLVDAGGGAHNKKFATLVLDTAIADFDEAIAAIKPKE